MATENRSQVELPRMPLEHIRNGTSSRRRRPMVGGVFVAVGYLLVGAALFLEFSQFHPLVDAFFVQHTGHSIASGGADRAGMAALNGDLAAIHTFPSLLLWLKLGGVAHILVGIFVVQVAVVRTLRLVPARLGYEVDE